MNEFFYLPAEWSAPRSMVLLACISFPRFYRKYLAKYFPSIGDQLETIIVIIRSIKGNDDVYRLQRSRCFKGGCTYTGCHE